MHAYKIWRLCKLQHTWNVITSPMSRAPSAGCVVMMIRTQKGWERNSRPDECSAVPACQTGKRLAKHTCSTYTMNLQLLGRKAKGALLFLRARFAPNEWTEKGIALQLCPLMFLMVRWWDGEMVRWCAEYAWRGRWRGHGGWQLCNQVIEKIFLTSRWASNSWPSSTPLVIASGSLAIPT